MSRRLALTALAGLALALTPARAGAQPVTDYVEYPTTVEGVPAGCAAPALTGVSFTVNSGPPAADLATAISPGVHAGDTIGLTWTGQTASCAPVLISLAIKHAVTPFFNPADNQELVAWASTVASGPGQLTLTLPDLTAYDEGPCFFQADAILGPPLAVVGPDGSFYSSASRGDTARDMLISFGNGAYDQCDTPETTTTTGPETTTTTTSVDTSQPPSAGQEAAPPVSPTPGPGEPSTGGGEPASEVPSSAAPATAALPHTGPYEFAAFAGIGAALIALGVAAVYVTAVYHRKGGRP